MNAERVSLWSGSSDVERESDGDSTNLTCQQADVNRRKSMALSTIPAFMLKKHPTYHGYVTGEEANDTLTRRGAPSYLIRFSESKNKFILSLATSENTFEHYGMSKENHQYTLDEADNIFPTIDALLDYYQTTPIDPDKPNTCLGRPCYRESRTEQPTYGSIQPMQTVREEPVMMTQSLVETDQDLINLAKPERELMGEHKSYHQAISGEEAERRLKRHGGSCYLTRYSEPQECYVLSVYQEIPNNKMKHFKIKIDDSEYSIDGTGHEFKEIGGLLSHYEEKRIDPAFETIGTAHEYQQYLQDLEREERERQVHCTIL